MGSAFEVAHAYACQLQCKVNGNEITEVWLAFSKQ